MDDTTKTLESQVDRFLDSKETSGELIQEVLWRLVDAIKEMLRSQRRSTVIAISFAVLFELLNRRLIDEAAFSGFRLSRLDFIRSLLPAAISYFILRFGVQARDLSVYLAVIDRITARKFQGLHASELNSLLGYVSGPTFGSMPRTYIRWQRVSTGAQLLELVVLTLGPLLFLCYAFWQLFSSNGYDDVLVWASLFLSTIFITLAFVFTLMAFGAAGDRFKALVREVFPPSQSRPKQSS
jgi:hypothetical protein